MKNQKEIFKIIGVKPYERFKLKDCISCNIEDNDYYIDNDFEVLQVVGGESDICCDNYLSLILAGSLEIIKYPTIKKKFRYWNKEDLIEYRQKECFYQNCLVCPFKNVECNPDQAKCWINHKDLYSKKFLNRKIKNS